MIASCRVAVGASGFGVAGTAPLLPLGTTGSITWRVRSGWCEVKVSLVGTFVSGVTYALSSTGSPLPATYRPTNGPWRGTSWCANNPGFASILTSGAIEGGHTTGSNKASLAFSAVYPV